MLERGSVAGSPATSTRQNVAGLSNIGTSRRRLVGPGHLSHDLFVRIGQPGEPSEIRGLDTWATIDGLREHYSDPGSMTGLDAIVAGPPVASVWEQAAGFNEW